MFKKTLPLIVGIALFSLLAGCDFVDLDNNSITSPSGTIMIQIPENNSSRTSIETEYASSNSDYYEAFIFNEDNLISASITSSGETISVPVGEYSVVVFAGKHIASSMRCLLGSGYASNVEVIEGQRTDITIQLTTPSATLTAPNEVTPNTEFEFEYYGSINNPYLTMKESGGNYYGSYHVDKGDLTLGRFKNATITNDSFSFTESLVSPATIMNLKIGINHVSIFLHVSNDNLIDTTWDMPDDYYCKLDGISEIFVDIIEESTRPTGLGITIEW